ncbi:MFS transporter [Petrocella atlantisensis]|uniref:MFS transporter n=1 Tax=Petrocella atlantisensis TaxID=2173034 RepID=A0A3P7P0C9_9FIRM|nr:OFA family MFS transporter [Petrocella atlantisensis]MCF8020241.1 OFA family MFS transporter [Vallitaleaceae bacterium]VDN48844.1 MFS transporter [Petrocella atlantisensis]
MLEYQNNQKIRETNPWVYVFLGIVIMMCLGTVYSWSIFRGSVEALFDVGTVQSGMPYMFSLAFYAFSMLVSGKYIDRFTPTSMMSVGGILVGIGWFASGYAENIYMLTLTYGAIVGIGVGIIYGVPISVVAKWFPNKRGLVVGLVLTGFGLSPFVTAPAAKALIETFGVLDAFKILGLSFAIIIPLLSKYIKLPEGRLFIIKPHHLENSDSFSTQEMMKTKSFKSLYICFVLGTMIGLTIIGMTNNIGVDLIGLSSLTAPLFVSVFAVFNGIGRPLFGWLTDKLSYKKVMLLSFILILTSASLMLFANEGSVVIYIISFSIFWMNLGGWLAIAPTSTLLLYGGKNYSQNYGVVFTAYGIGAIAGVYVSGLLFDYFNHHDVIFYFIISLCLLGIVLSQSMPKNQ